AQQKVQVSQHHCSPTSPLALLIIARRWGAAPLMTSTSRLRRLHCFDKSAAAGDSTKNRFSVHPLGASSEGCSESRPHSMKNGSSPARSSCNLKDFQCRVLPSGRAREPSLGPSTAKPAATACFAEATMSVVWTAQSNKRGSAIAFNLSYHPW